MDRTVWGDGSALIVVMMKLKMSHWHVNEDEVGDIKEDNNKAMSFWIISQATGKCFVGIVNCSIVRKMLLILLIFMSCFLNKNLHKWLGTHRAMQTSTGLQEVVFRLCRYVDMERQKKL